MNYRKEIQRRIVSVGHTNCVCTSALSRSLNLLNKRSRLWSVQRGRTNVWQHADSSIRHLSFLAGSCQVIFIFLWVIDFQETIKTLRSCCILRTFHCSSRKKLLNRLRVKQLARHFRRFRSHFIALIPQPCRPILIIVRQSVDFFVICLCLRLLFVTTQLHVVLGGDTPHNRTCLSSAAWISWGGGGTFVIQISAWIPAFLSGFS